MCCPQEMRWRGHETRFMGVTGRRYKFWWSGNKEETEGVGIMVKKELCEKVVEVRRKSDRVMTLVLAFEGKLVRLICAYGPQNGRALVEKDQFYDKMKNE